MSKQVDEKVVSMQFDNAQFEKNVSTTMSTVDKLKQKLNFKDSSKGLENVSTAAKNVNMSGLGGAVDTVRSKFSAMEVIGVTALANITNSAVNAGKRIVSALTIDPVTTGFKEYETQINAVQTILANTESKGTTIDDVNKALDTLNTYADKTIYNFTEMTRNIGTFTAAGVELDTSVNAIQGIANLAAVSGSTSQQASTAMYQLSQALASGTVKLMDWNSVVNAGMGGEVFQNALKETARVHGVAIDSMIKEEGSFRETLSKGWLTSEILTETLGKFTMATEGATEAEIEANRTKLKSLGYTDEQIEGIFKLGNTATNAATKVKTFTQLWDVLKESAQSGWSKTWKLIIGDFEDAKSLLTPLADFLTGIINKFSDWRNNLLEGALGKTFKGLSERISGLTKPLGKVSDVVDKVTASFDYLDKISDEVIMGKWDVGSARLEALTDSGYNYYAVQNMVNEKMGDSYRYSEEMIESQNKLLRTQNKTTESTSDAANANAKLTETDIDRIATLAELSDAELKAKDYTDDQIKAIRELQAVSEKLGIPLKELLTNLDEINGRWLLMNGFKNIGKGIVKVFKAIGDAWSEIFPPASSDFLFDIIAGFHKLSTKLVMSDESADKLKRTFKGLFALLKLTFTLVSGPFKIAFKVLSAILGYFNLDILSVTAYIGDAIVAFCDWIDRVLDFGKIVAKVIPALKTFGKSIWDWIVGIKDAENIPKYIFGGLINGLLNGASSVWNVLKGLVTGIIDYVKNLLGIHSPSTVFIAIGGFIIAGLVMGLTGSFPDVLNFFKGMGDKISNVIKNIDWGTVFAALISIGMVVSILKFADALGKLASPFESFGNVLTSVSKGIKSFSLALKAEAIKSIATSILILVGAIAILTLLDTKKMLWAVSAIVIILGALVGALVFIGKMGKDGDVKIAKFALVLTSLAGAMLILSWVMKILGGMEADAFKQALLGIAAFAGIIALLTLVSKFAGSNVDDLGKTIFKIAGAMIMLAIVAKIAGGMHEHDMIRAGIVIGAFTVVIIGLMAATKLVGDNALFIGKTISKIATAMLMLVIVAKIAGGMHEHEMIRAAIAITFFGGIIVGLIAATKLAGGNGGNIDRIGKTILGIAAAMLILVLVAKIAGSMNEQDMIRGGIAILVLGGIIVGLIAATKLAGGNSLDKVGRTLIAISIAIGILAAVSLLLSLMSWEGLAKGLIAVGVLTGLMVALIAVTKIATQCEKSMFALAAVIAILAASVVALSFIKLENLIPAVAAMTILMGMLMLVINSTKNAGEAMKTLIVIGLIVAIMGQILHHLGSLPAQAVLSSAIGLSLLLGVLTGMTLAVGKIKKVPMAAIGALALMGLVVAELALILGLMSKFNVGASMETASALSLLIISLSGSLILLSVVGNLGSGAFIGIAALATLILALGAVMVGIGALMDKVPEMEQFLDKGITVLEKIGYGLGSFLGNIVGGLLAGLTAGLPVIGSNLSAFMINLQPFIDGVKSIDAEMVTGVLSLAAMILALTAASILEGIASIFGLDHSLEDFGEQLVPFGKSLAEFSKEVAGKVDNSAVQAAANAGKMMAEMAKTIPNSGGVVGWFMGENDIDDFGKKLVPFGKAITEFSKEVAGKVDEGAVQAAANAGKMMAEMAKTIPNSGGVVGWFMGENDIDDFGKRLVSFGKSITEFSDEVAGNVDEEAVTAAANAGSIMVEMAKEIPNTGGVLGWLAGNNDIDDFGDMLVSFGESMASFSKEVSGKIDSDAVTAAANACGVMVEIARDIPNSGGMVSWFTGDNDIDDFGEKLVSFGESMGEFSREVSSGVDAAAVDAAANAGEMLIKMAKILSDDDGALKSFAENGDFSGLGTPLGSYADAMKDFSSALSGGIDSEAVKTAADACGALADLAHDIPSTGGLKEKILGAKDLAGFITYIGPLGEAMVKFSSYVDDDALDADAVTAAANAAKALGEMDAALAYKNGAITTQIDPEYINNFVGCLPELGSGLAAFSTAVTGKIDEDAVEVATEAAVTLATALCSLPKVGGLKAQFSGDYMSITNYTNAIRAIGNAIASFGYMTSSSIEYPNRVLEILNLLDPIFDAYNNMIEDYKDFDETSADGYFYFITAIGGTMGELYLVLKDVDINTIMDKMTGIETIITDYIDFSDSATKITDLNNAISGIAGVMYKLYNAPTPDAESLSNIIKSCAEVNIDTALQVFTDAETDFNTAGSDLITEFETGLTSLDEAIKTDCETLAKDCADAIDSDTNIKKFKNAAMNLVKGFANGIGDYAYLAESAGRSLVTSTEKAVKDEMDSHSPSRVFIGIGKYIPQGFAIGIDKFSGVVEKSATSMAGGAINRVRDSIARISDMVSSDIDSQPTIRPVLDLSEIRTGTGAISDMLDMGSSISVRARVGSVSSMMNERLQNGDNSDVVSAIKDLGRKLNNMSGDNYNINGVTYDDGSNINDAVKTIVRAARIARRV